MTFARRSHQLTLLAIAVNIAPHLANHSQLFSLLCFSMFFLRRLSYGAAMAGLLSCFLWLALYILENPLANSSLVVADLVLITGIMYEIHFPKHSGFSFLTMLKNILRLLLPILIVLGLIFLGFPLVQKALKKNPDAASSGFGFDDRLNAGDISSLILSDAVVFHARFSATQLLPEPSSIYWRGGVLMLSSGLQWHGRLNDTSAEMNNESTIEQDILLEARKDTMAFALDWPNRFIHDAEAAPGAKQLYKAFSSAGPLPQDLSSGERQLYLQLPLDIDAQTRSLVASWQRQTSDPKSIAALALDFFAHSGFTYTLSPGRLGKTPLAEFLFSEKKGFCEHYAGAYATLMRLAGIPARIVTGFQGGEINRFNRTIVVRQLDAHVWVELWSDKLQTWERVDPTAHVAPERFANAAAAHSGTFVALTMLADALSSNWSYLTLSSGQQFSAINVAVDWQGLGRIDAAPLCIGLVILVLALVLLWRLWRYPSRHSAAEIDAVLSQCFAAYSAKLRRLGISRLIHEGPVTLLQRAIVLRPDLSPALAEFTRCYLSLRYGPVTIADVTGNRLRLDELEEALKLVKAAKAAAPLSRVPRLGD